MITNSQIKGEQIFKDICKILTSPSGQDARISEIDKIVAKKVSEYIINFCIDELDFNDGTVELLENVKQVIKRC